MSSGFGAQSAWRQIVDLAGRGRVALDEPVLARLRMLRQAVPPPVRAASARALAYARPDARLVGFFAEDELAVAAPILRTAALPAQDWLDLLPRLSPALRSVLRHRRDLPAEVSRGLDSFGAIDFVLPEPEAAAPQAPASSPEELDLIAPPEPAAPEVAAPLGADRAEKPAGAPDGGFMISDLVTRIDAHRRARDDGGEAARPAHSPDAFRFETDAVGAITSVDGVAPGALVGLSIAHAAVQGLAQVDGVATGGFRRRAPFGNARLEVGGASDAAGSWRLSGAPAFDPLTGRFLGFSGAARRPRADETAAPRERPPSPGADSVRQLVHELRTPANAIAGFAELIETELLGEVPEPYRGRAGAIRRQAADLLAAIEDLDIAARVESGALELRPTAVPLAPLLAQVIADLQPLAALRGVEIASEAHAGPAAFADDRAVERVLARLLGTIVAAGRRGERVGVELDRYVSGQVLVLIDRPAALRGLSDEALLALDPEGEPPAGAPLLGAGFAFRVSRNLAAELGGALSIAPDRFSLQLPAAEMAGVEQATTI